MLAQVSLTPAESKKLIGIAVSNMPQVKRANECGKVVLHPSSSTLFVAQQLLGERPQTNFWVCGAIVPKGACVEIGTCVGEYAIASKNPEDSATTGNPGVFKFSWVISRGKLETGIKLSELLENMGPEDVYIKGVNALDPAGRVGVLIGNLVEGGTIARVISAAERKGFTVIYPVGLEKLIPGPIEDAVREAKKNEYKYSMGIACSLFPCREGIVVTEIEAIKYLAGPYANATPIASGGIGGAEGAITLVVNGSEEEVKRAINYIEQVKGAQLPQVRTFYCPDCHQPICQFPLGGKPWAS